MCLKLISKKIFLLLLISVFSCSTSDDQLQRNELVYNNDFESGDLDDIFPRKTFKN